MYTEEWKQINELDNYEVSTSGRVRNKKTKRVLRETYSNSGRAIVKLRKNNKYVNKGVATLVAEAFIDEPRNGRRVRHVDKNKTNNYLSNLSYDKQESDYVEATKIGKIRKLSSVNGCTRYEISKKELKILVNETDQIYLSVEACANALCISQEEVAQCLHQKQKTSNGYTLMLVTY